MSTLKIDWRRLADELGTITRVENGHSELGSDKLARQAIIRVIGDGALIDAVDYFISHEPGSELARHVLWLLRPAAAMQRCLEIYRDSDDEQQASDAIYLLQVVSDERVLEAVPEILSSDCTAVRRAGIGIIDQLVWSGEIEIEQAMPFIETAFRDSDAHVRERAQQILDMQSGAEA